MNNSNSLRSLKDSELIFQLKNMAQKERELLKMILLYIAEIDHRRLYLKMSFPSLFEYLHREIGYSQGAAQRRIDAARLLQKVPELGQKIESGSISLSQISQLQKTIRHHKRETNRAVSVDTQKSLLRKIENQSSQATEIIIHQELDLPVEIFENKKFQKDNSVRVELTLTQEQHQLLELLQQKHSHQLRGSRNMKDLLLFLAHRDSTRNSKTTAKDSTDNSNPIAKSGRKPKIQNEPACAATVAVKDNKTLTPKVKQIIMERDQCCQFRDPETNRICGSRFFLQIDHIHPQWDSGGNQISNLRVLCQGHNRYRYETGR